LQKPDSRIPEAGDPLITQSLGKPYTSVSTVGAESSGSVLTRTSSTLELGGVLMAENSYASPIVAITYEDTILRGISPYMCDNARSPNTYMPKLAGRERTAVLLLMTRVN
jgi:hypothetical protein